MKKIILVLLLTCLILVTFSVVVVFADETIAINDINAKALQQIVAEKLGVGDYTYELLADFDRPDRYTLVEGDGCYLIYDNQLQDFVEYSTDDNSEYYSLDSGAMKIYSGPSYYYSLKDGQVTDISNGQQLDESAVVAFAHSEEMGAYSFSVQSSSTFQQPNTNYQIQATALTDEQKRVAYFMGLNHNIGLNDQYNYPGNCSIVAIGMMLSYFDTVRDDRIIGEEFDVTSNRLSATSLSNISMEAYNESPGINAHFQQYLVSVAIECGFYNENTTDFGLTGDQIQSLFNICVARCIPGATVTQDDVASAQKCRYLMDQYGPIMVALTSGSIGGHVVVAYQYSGVREINAKFGWRDVVVNENIINMNMDYFYYIEFANNEHYCSNNYIWSCNGSTGTYCPCGAITCYHEAGKNCVSTGSVKHNYVCKTCGSTVSSGNHTYPVSGDTRKCTECGYIKPHAHNYIYTPSGIGKHRKVCFGCRTNEIETCMAFINPDGTSVCGKCGQTIPDGVIYNCIEEQEKIEEVFRALAMPVQPQIILPQ